MITIISGPRDLHDYDVVCAAIKESGFEISEVVCGDAKGVDLLVVRWAEANNIPVTVMCAKWNDLKVKGATVKKNNWGQKYNCLAGFQRNSAMVEYVKENNGACVVIQTGSPGTNDTLKKAWDAELHVFEYDPDDYLGDDDVYLF